MSNKESESKNAIIDNLRIAEDNFSDFVLNEIKNTQEQSSKPKKQK